VKVISVNWVPFFIAMTVGCVVNYLGDWLIGIRIELFWGLETFNFLWFIQLFILPVFAGIAVSMVYGLGGKWIAIPCGGFAISCRRYQHRLWMAWGNSAMRHGCTNIFLLKIRSLLFPHG